MMIGTTLGVVRVEHVDDATIGGRDVYIDDYGGRWIRTNYTEETSPTGVRVGYLQSDGSIYMFDQTFNGTQTVQILISESQDLTI